MESGTWRLSLSNDYSDDHEDNDEDCGEEVEYGCPYCTDDLDIVGLLCHIEEHHYDEAKIGVCPLCDAIVGVDLVKHIAFQHEDVYKSDVDPQSTIALIKKEMMERSLKSLAENSSSAVSCLSAAADQLLTSFIYAYSTSAESETEPSCSLDDASVKEGPADENVLERSMKNCVISEELEEQTQRSKFVQSLLLSTFLNDGL